MILIHFNVQILLHVSHRASQINDNLVEKIIFLLRVAIILVLYFYLGSEEGFIIRANRDI